MPRNAPFFATTSTPRSKTISQFERTNSGRVIQGDACLSMTIFRAPESSAFCRISVESSGSNPNDDALTTPFDAADLKLTYRPAMSMSYLFRTSDPIRFIGAETMSGDTSIPSPTGSTPFLPTSGASFAFPLMSTAGTFAASPVVGQPVSRERNVKDAPESTRTSTVRSPNFTGSSTLIGSESDRCTGRPNPASDSLPGANTTSPAPNETMQGTRPIVLMPKMPSTFAPTEACKWEMSSAIAPKSQNSAAPSFMLFTRM